MAYIFFSSLRFALGYDGLPIDSAMQGLDLNSHHGGSTYNNATDSTSNNHNDNNYENESVQDLPAPPTDNNQVAAWYDTDL